MRNSCVLCFLLLSFTGVALGEVPTAKVDLGTAAGFAILSKAGITNVPTSAVIGNMGVSPIASTAMTGFGITCDVAHPEYCTAAEVRGKIFAPDYAGNTAGELTIAIGSMETAYTDAASRATSVRHENEIVTGEVFTPGVHTWPSTGISFVDAIYLNGSPTDIFIFQTTGNVVVGNGARMILMGGVKASNIFWQMAGYLQAGTTSHLEGVFLVKTQAVFQTGSTMNGRIMAQTAVTLDHVTVVQPPVRSLMPPSRPPPTPPEETDPIVNPSLSLPPPPPRPPTQPTGTIEGTIGGSTQGTTQGTAPDTPLDTPPDTPQDTPQDPEFET